MSSHNSKKKNPNLIRFVGFIALVICTMLVLFAIKIAPLINITMPGTNEPIEILSVIVKVALFMIPFMGGLAGLMTLVTGDISHIKEFFEAYFKKNK